uniref:Receptor ligand binding region domain-containing protein n=1 Tax=Biomphalaria glabrata TaxID=6526 RepID=A0A2C9L8R9_BIOGL
MKWYWLLHFVTLVTPSHAQNVAKSVAEFGGQFGVGIISPTDRDPALSSKNKYPTFVRTVPSFSVFAKAVAELLYQLQWQNVAVIYTIDDDGSSGYQQLLQAIITNALAVDDSMDKTTYRAALNSFKLNTFKVAIVVANSAVTQVILDAANDVMTSPNNVQWILSDLDITNDQRSLPQARGSLVVVPKFPKISNFVEQFVNYLVAPNVIVDNPWFTEW